MTFNQLTWVDDITAASAANMNRLEQGVADLYVAAPVVVTLNNQSADFDLATGLQGETDAGYIIEMIGRVSASAGSTGLLRPNADASNNYAGVERWLQRDGTGNVTAGQGPLGDAGLRLWDTYGGVGGSMTMRGMLSSRSQSGLFGRTWMATSAIKSEFTDGRSQMLDFMEWWNPVPASTVLNKLTINFAGAAFTGKVRLTRL